jgi:hypothetical protein
MAAKWTSLTARVVAAAGVAVLLGTAATPAAAAPTVSCVYTIKPFSGFFMADLTIVNNGTAAINGWQARWTFTTPTTNLVGWQAYMTQQGDVVYATNMSFNTVIAPGQNTTFGWSAMAATTDVPKDITVNGAPCPT